MERVGVGWQFEVFDCGNGRVLKKPFKGIRQFRHIYEQTKHRSLRALGEWIRVSRERSRTTSKFRTHLTYVPPELLGNAVIRSDGCIEQDKVTPLVQVFDAMSEDEQCAILVRYANSILEHWQWGFCDKIFNFHVNNALDAQGRLILIDFGEVLFAKNEVAKRIINRRWLRSNSYRVLDDKLKTFYANLMDRTLTLSALDELWEKKLPI